MLPKINRIKKEKDFEAIFKNSKSVKNNLFIFKIAKNNLGINRFGFIVSKKVSPKAVIRNKARRRMAALARALSKRIKASTDVLLIALPGIEKKGFSDIKDAFEAALKKSGAENNI